MFCYGDGPLCEEAPIESPRGQEPRSATDKQHQERASLWWLCPPPPRPGQGHPCLEHRHATSCLNPSTTSLEAEGTASVLTRLGANCLSSSMVAGNGSREAARTRGRVTEMTQPREQKHSSEAPRAPGMLLAGRAVHPYPCPQHQQRSQRQLSSFPGVWSNGKGPSGCVLLPQTPMSSSVGGPAAPRGAPGRFSVMRLPGSPPSFPYLIAGSGLALRPARRHHLPHPYSSAGSLGGPLPHHRLTYCHQWPWGAELGRQEEGRER